MYDNEIICGTVREVEIRYKAVKDIQQGTRISNSANLFAAFRERMISERVEIFQTVMLTSRNRVMAIETVARGSLTSTVVHPRDVFAAPVRLQASAIICMHNHPGGDPSPSPEDRACTERLMKAGAILGIRVLDHIIIGFNDYFSFRDSGVMGTLKGVDAWE